MNASRNRERDEGALKEQGLFNRRMIGLAILATVGFGFLQGARLLDLNSGPYNPNPFAPFGLLIDGGTFLVVALLSYAGKFDRVQPLFWLGIGASVVYAALALSGSRDDVVLILVQAASGMCWSLMILCWMAVFTSYRPSHALLMIAAGYGLDTLMQPIASALFPEYRQVAFVVVFVVAAVMLYLCLRNKDAVVQHMKESVVPQTSMAEAFSRTRRAVAGTCVFSLICGFIIQIDLDSGLRYAQSNLTAIFSIAVALIMCLAIIALKIKKANIDSVCPIAALCLASILLFRSFPGSDEYLAGALMTTFLMSFYVLLWLTFISEAYERKLPAFFLLGLALGVARISVGLGRFLADTTMVPLSLDPHLVFICCIWLLVVTVSLIFASYLRYTSKQRSHRLEDAPDELSTSTDVSANADGAALDLLAETYALSEREAQIIGEFSAGRSARYIADYYVISEHTVKTHLRRAYSKLDIHSRQELLDRIDEAEANLRDPTNRSHRHLA